MPIPEDKKPAKMHKRLLANLQEHVMSDKQNNKFEQLQRLGYSFHALHMDFSVEMVMDADEVTPSTIVYVERNGDHSNQ